MIESLSIAEWFLVAIGYSLRAMACVIGFALPPTMITLSAFWIADRIQKK